MGADAGVVDSDRSESEQVVTLSLYLQSVTAVANNSNIYSFNTGSGVRDSFDQALRKKKKSYGSHSGSTSNFGSPRGLSSTSSLSTAIGERSWRKNDGEQQAWNCVQVSLSVGLGLGLRLTFKGLFLYTVNFLILVLHWIALIFFCHTS